MRIRVNAYNIMIETKQIYWIAAFLDGEGYFGFTAGPVITVCSTDLDTIQRYDSIVKSSGSILKVDKRSGSHRDQYKLSMYGNRAVSWMMTIFSLMSKRRQDKIKEIINNWKIMTNRSSDSFCKLGHPLIGKNLREIYNDRGYSKVCRKCESLARQVRKVMRTD